MDDLAALAYLAVLIAAFLTVAGGLPGRLCDWIDRRILAPHGDDPAVQGRAVQTSHNS